jgi:hypothetical protein
VCAANSRRVSEGGGRCQASCSRALGAQLLMGVRGRSIGGKGTKPPGNFEHLNFK